MKPSLLKLILSVAGKGDVGASYWKAKLARA